MRGKSKWVAGLALIAGTACGGHRGGPTGPDDQGGVQPPANGVASFTVLPLDLAKVGVMTSLGHLGPVGHVLPTDHVYFYQSDFDHPPAQPVTDVLPVYAPAAGTVNFTLLQSPSHDWKVMFVVTKEFGYYFDHLQPRADLHVGSVVQAGEQVGTTNPGGSLDLGAWDTRVTLPGLMNPARYVGQTLHCVSPWKYFTDSLKALIYPRIRRAPGVEDKDGRIDYGVAGRLVGDWFDQGLPIGDTMGPLGWPRSLSFAFDEYDPRLVRVSIGGTISAPGLWTIPPDAPRPADVTVASGKVSYRLMYTGSTNIQWGLMIVQMLSDTRIRIQVFQGSQAATAEFDGNAFTYVR